jgi:hypothetical protein
VVVHVRGPVVSLGLRTLAAILVRVHDARVVVLVLLPRASPPFVGFRLQVLGHVGLPADVPPRRPPGKTDATVPTSAQEQPDAGERDGKDQDTRDVTERRPERANRVARTRGG